MITTLIHNTIEQVLEGLQQPTRLCHSKKRICMDNDPKYYLEDDGELVTLRCPSCGSHDTCWDRDHWKCDECSCVWED